MGFPIPKVEAGTFRRPASTRNYGSSFHEGKAALRETGQEGDERMPCKHKLRLALLRFANTRNRVGQELLRPIKALGKFAERNNR